MKIIISLINTKYQSYSGAILQMYIITQYLQVFTIIKTQTVPVFCIRRCVRCLWCYSYAIPQLPRIYLIKEFSCFCVASRTGDKIQSQISCPNYARPYMLYSRGLLTSFHISLHDLIAKALVIY